MRKYSQKKSPIEKKQQIFVPEKKKLFVMVIVSETEQGHTRTFFSLIQKQ